MAKDTYESWVEGPDDEILAWWLANGIYGTTERVQAAINRIKDWKMQPGDLDTAYPTLT